MLQQRLSEAVWSPKPRRARFPPAASSRVCRNGRPALSGPSTPLSIASCFFFNDTATTEIYPLSLHDALPICYVGRRAVDGFEHTGAVRAQGRGRQQADAAREHRRLVAEDVAEHVLGEDHVEMAGIGDELHRGVVDEHVLQLDVRELAAVDA